MRGSCSRCLIAIAMVGALVACNQSQKPEEHSAVRTPEPTGAASPAASSTDANPTNSTLDPFDRQVRSYLDQTKPLRAEAAKAAQTLTEKNNRPADAEAAVRARQAALAASIRTSRPSS